MAEKTDEYNGCLKSSIERARDYARTSFVYGFKTKDELKEEFNVSAHTVENNTRNMGDWFQDCLKIRTIAKKQVKYISLNCRNYSANPLYKMWKACSFTTNDIVFFFFLLNYLSNKEEPVSFDEIFNEYSLMHRSDGLQLNSTRWWLENKGIPSGLIVKAGRGKYRLAQTFDLSQMRDLLQYYSEIAPCGVIGSFVLDKLDVNSSPFGFKQHYIGQAFDSEIICNALLAIKNDRSVMLKYLTRGKIEICVNVFPLKVYSSTQNGRQYLFAWDAGKECFFNYRLDRIKSMSISAESLQDADQIREKFEDVKKHIWGVSLDNRELVHVEFTVKINEDEFYIVNRLNREKRCGTVVPVENCPGLIRFSADVYDAHEMFPWIRTFIGRIAELKISDKKMEDLFRDSIQEMYNIYF
ncbi:MAG: WYL domain-containing protein [Eubacterium sp.]|nr:WYL domain-containing protein [Eubacterium sp.]